MRITEILYRPSALPLEPIGSESDAALFFIAVYFLFVFVCLRGISIL